MRRAACLALHAALIASPAAAFDPTRAAGYPSPDLYRPTMDQLDVVGSGGARVIANRSAPSWSTSGVLTVQNRSVTADDIAAPTVPPGWFNEDGVRSVMVLDDGAAAINTSAFAFYVRNRSPSTGQARNATGLFGLTTCEVDGCASWGINPALIDAARNGAAGTGRNRRLIGAEFDISVTNPDTIVQGIGLMGSSSAKPKGADGFSCSDLGGLARWTHCFVSGNGFVDTALYVGTRLKIDPGARPALNPGTPSQTVTFGYIDPQGRGGGIDLLASLGGFSILPAGGRGTGLNVVTSPARDGGTVALAPGGDGANKNLRIHASGAGRVLLDSPVQSSQPLTVDALVTGNRGFQAASTPFANVGAFPQIAGTMLYCADCREPGQAAGAGTGTLIVYNGSAWRAVGGGPARN